MGYELALTIINKDLLCRKSEWLKDFAGITDEELLLLKEYIECTSNELVISDLIHTTDVGEDKDGNEIYDHSSPYFDDLDEHLKSFIINGGELPDCIPRENNTILVFTHDYPPVSETLYVTSVIQRLISWKSGLKNNTFFNFE